MIEKEKWKLNIVKRKWMKPEEDNGSLRKSLKIIVFVYDRVRIQSNCAKNLTKEMTWGKSGLGTVKESKYDDTVIND